MAPAPPARPPRLAWTLIVLILNAAILLTSCDFLESPAAMKPAYVLESYQIAGEPLGPVRLMETRPTDRKYDPREAAVTGAQVELQLLAEEDSVAARHPYRPAPGRPGIYVPIREDARVRPLGRYRLRALVGDSLIRALTTVPDTFSLAPTNPDTVVYGGPQPFGIRVTESAYPGRAATYLLNTTIPDAQRTHAMLTPAGKDLVEGTEALNGGSPYTLGSLAGNEWPMRSAESYPRGEDGRLRITYPWENFVYYGPNTVHVHAVGENLRRFWRGDKAQAGGAPGVIPNVRDQVEGGTGLLAGLARARYVVYVARPEE